MELAATVIATNYNAQRGAFTVIRNRAKDYLQLTVLLNFIMSYYSDHRKQDRCLSIPKRVWCSITNFVCLNDTLHTSNNLPTTVVLKQSKVVVIILVLRDRLSFWRNSLPRLLKSNDGILMRFASRSSKRSYYRLTEYLLCHQSVIKLSSHKPYWAPVANFAAE